jgi:hypothetical protein
VSVEEIERAVKRLPQRDFARLAAWFDQRRRAVGGHENGKAAGPGRDWFEVYMACPHSFEIPRRKKQFYKPKP